MMTERKAETVFSVVSARIAVNSHSSASERWRKSAVQPAPDVNSEGNVL